MRWISKKPPQHVRHGDHWFKEDDGTLWIADAQVEKAWLPIRAVTFEVMEGASIPFPPKTKIYAGDV